MPTSTLASERSGHRIRSLFVRFSGHHALTGYAAASCEKRLRLRGIYGRVVKDGRVSVGDKVARLG
jgi:hypothetical protein